MLRVKAKPGRRREDTAAVAAAVGGCHPIPDVPRGPVQQFDVVVTGQGLAARLLLAGQPPTSREPGRPQTPDRACQRPTAGISPGTRCPARE